LDDVTLKQINEIFFCEAEIKKGGKLSAKGGTNKRKLH
jgi:hypothetical protein